MVFSALNGDSVDDLAGCRLLRDTDLADLLQLDRRTIWRMVSTGELPQPLRFAARVTRWRAKDVREWLDGLTVGGRRR